MCSRLRLFLLLLLYSVAMQAQDTLPEFSVVAKAGNRNVISWTNTFSQLAQIHIQRSGDSLSNFKTIMTVPDPNVQNNGFVDTKAPAGVSFYKLLIVFPGGKYQFTATKRPMPDDGRFSDDAFPTTETPRKGEKFFFVKKNGVVVDGLLQRHISKFRDSIVFTTRDTMLIVAADTILIKPLMPKETFRSGSRHVYTERSGHLTISLPEAETKKYSLMFFEEDKTPLFEIAEVESTYLVVDKANFIHAGWFWYELYEDGTLMERNRFYIPREF